MNDFKGRPSPCKPQRRTALLSFLVFSSRMAPLLVRRLRPAIEWATSSTPKSNVDHLITRHSLAQGCTYSPTCFRLLPRKSARSALKFRGDLLQLLAVFSPYTTFALYKGRMNKWKGLATVEEEKKKKSGIWEGKAVERKKGFCCQSFFFVSSVFSFVIHFWY